MKTILILLVFSCLSISAQMVLVATTLKENTKKEISKNDSSKIVEKKIIDLQKEVEKLAKKLNVKVEKKLLTKNK